MMMMMERADVAELGRRAHKTRPVAKSRARLWWRVEL